MSIQLDSLLENAAAFTRSILSNELPEQVLYHDLDYVELMVASVKEIGVNSDLRTLEVTLLQLAAWFEQVGYKNGIQDHAIESRRIAKTYLEGEKAKDEVISQVDQYLEFLSSERSPTHSWEKVLHDASLFHFTTSDFIQKLPLLYKEEQLIFRRQQKQGDWYQKVEKQLLGAKFHTKYADQAYSKQLEENRKLISKKRKKIEKQIDGMLQKDLRIDESELKELKKKLKKVDKRPERGVETMFRLASKNHFTLNEMVDKKSSILISINSIILSIVIGTVMRQLSADPHLVVPVIMLAITNLWSIVLAVFATRPEKTHGKFTPGKTSNESTNLLFYGNFHQMTENEYLSGIEGLMNDGDKLYCSLAKDVYYLGKTLERKFSLLRRSFNIFVVGFIASVVTFIICHLFFGSQSVIPTF